MTREEVIMRLKNIAGHAVHIPGEPAFVMSLDDGIAVHEAISYIEAQTEVIRCKDCKYVGTDATCCLVCDREGMGLKPYHVYHDDFCSYAERRTDESD